MSDPGGAHHPAIAQPAVLISASPDYLDAAFLQLREAVPRAIFERIGPDAGLVGGPDISIERLADVCRSNRVVFIRHLAQIRSVLAIGDGSTVFDSIVDEAKSILNTLPAEGRDQPISLQLWTSGQQSSEMSERPDLVRRQLASRLGEDGWNIRRSGAPQVLSLLLTKRRAYLGLNNRDDGLSDWPGGHVGLAKSRDSISRSEFKLDELFQTHNLDLPQQATALDLGASPGGWTRIMRQRGFRVTAVDPGLIDPRLASDPGIEWISATFGEYLAHADSRFDVILNDMRMPSELSVDAMLRARKLLRPEGTLIMSLKLAAGVGPSHAVRTVEQSLRQLGRGFDVLFARQLFHNRHEITVVAGNRG